MNKKGFTLIELLAVIVILAIIALIATPMVLNTIDDARSGAAKSSATTYIKELETEVIKSMMTTSPIKEGKYKVGDITVDLKGDKPSEGNICVSSDGTVSKASLKINGYVINYDGKETKNTDLKEVEDITCGETSTETTTPSEGETETPNEGNTTPEVTQVELKDASDAVKEENNYFGEVTSLLCGGGNVYSNFGMNDAGWEVNDIIYISTSTPNPCAVAAYAGTDYVFEKGYYKITNVYSSGGYTQYMLGTSATYSGYIEHLGESYLVNAQ